MIQALFERLTLRDFHDDVLRNIKTVRSSQDLYDDLSDDPRDWQAAITAELTVKPDYSDPDIIRRPFEESDHFNAIGFPFEHWNVSRYSDGRYGVWYGGDTLETTIHETVYHWRRFLAAAEGFATHDREIVGERRVFRVRCDAALLDFRPRVADFPALIAPDDYHYTHEVGRRVKREGHPGILSKSARCDGGQFAVFRADVLSDPRNCCDLTYRIDPRHGVVDVERQVGVRLMRLQ